MVEPRWARIYARTALHYCHKYAAILGSRTKGKKERTQKGTLHTLRCSEATLHTLVPRTSLAQHQSSPSRRELQKVVERAKLRPSERGRTFVSQLNESLDLVQLQHRRRQRSHSTYRTRSVLRFSNTASPFQRNRRTEIPDFHNDLYKLLKTVKDPTRISNSHLQHRPGAQRTTTTAKPGTRTAT